MNKFLKLVDELKSVDKELSFGFEYWDDNCIYLKCGLGDINKFTIKVNKKNKRCLLQPEFIDNNMTADDIDLIHTVMNVVDENIDVLLGEKENKGISDISKVLYDIKLKDGELIKGVYFTQILDKVYGGRGKVILAEYFKSINVYYQNGNLVKDKDLSEFSIINIYTEDGQDLNGKVFRIFYRDTISEN